MVYKLRQSAAKRWQKLRGYPAAFAAGLFIVGAEDASRADLDVYKVIKKRRRC